MKATVLFFLVATLFVVTFAQTEAEDKDYLVENAHNLHNCCGQGPFKDELNKKSIPELIDLVIKGLQTRYERKLQNYPEQAEALKENIKYFEEMGKKYV